MANKQINELTELTSVATDDKLPIYDASTGGEAKYITADNLIPEASLIVKGKVELATTAETTAGTDDTRAVTPAGIMAVMELLNPIGTIREFNVSTNPATLLGFGTWSAYGTGRVTIAIDAGDTKFDTVDETGGAEEVTLTTTELPAHTHTVDPPSTSTSSDGAHTHTTGLATDGDQDGSGSNGATYGTGLNTGSSGAHTHTVDIAQFNTGSSGTGSAFSIMNPYIVVYRWVRTA